MNERCILNPHQFVPELPELDLDSLGLAVRVEGVDWGEASITPQMVKGAQGETSAAGRRDGVPIRIPIRVKEEGGIPLAEAAFKLESVVAGWQEEGGWALRDYDDEAGFAGSLGYRIIRHTANLSGLQGWLMAWSRDVPDVILTATRWPVGLSPEEYKSEKVTMAEGERELIIDLPADLLGGSVPGLIRYRIDNENEEEHLKGLWLATEWRDHAQDETADTTAALAYDCVDLTLVGAAEAAERDGVDVVRHSSLTKGWVVILDTEIDGVGHMTFTGPRRPQLRIWTGDEDVELKLRSRSLGTLNWAENDAVSAPLLGDWSLVDLGEARPEPPVIGDPRWQGQILARATSGAGAVDLARFRPYPTEQFTVLSAPGSDQVATEVETKSPGTVVDGGGSGKTWSSTSNAKIEDGSCAKVTF